LCDAGLTCQTGRHNRIYVHNRNQLDCSFNERA
jgi:hypothetical protein